VKKNRDFTWDTGWTLTRFNRLFHQVSGRFPTAPDWAGETSHPPMDIFEDETGVHIHVEVPGMTRDELSVRLNQDQLTIEGFKHRGNDLACLRYICVEREFGVFRRIVKISVSVDASGGKAALKDGILEVILPKVIERRRSIIDIPIDS